MIDFSRDPKGLESYEGPDGWWVLGKSGDQTTALLCRFSRYGRQLGLPIATMQRAAKAELDDLNAPPEVR